MVKKSGKNVEKSSTGKRKSNTKQKDSVTTKMLKRWGKVFDEAMKNEYEVAVEMLDDIPSWLPFTFKELEEKVKSGEMDVFFYAMDYGVVLNFPVKGVFVVTSKKFEKLPLVVKEFVEKEIKDATKKAEKEGKAVEPMVCLKSFGKGEKGFGALIVYYDFVDFDDKCEYKIGGGPLSAQKFKPLLKNIIRSKKATNEEKEQAKENLKAIEMIIEAQKLVKGTKK